jgi:PAS domain S-box-containing protein
MHPQRGTRPGAGRELEDLFNLSLDLLCIMTVDGYFKRVNPAFERTLGYTSEQLLSRPFFDFVHPEDLERTHEAMRVLARGEELHRFENRYICSDGSERWLQWNSRPGPEEGLVCGAARDVTESRERDEHAALRRVATLAAEGVPAFEVFDAVAAEIRQLLRADVTSLMRYEQDATVTVVAASDDGVEIAAGARLPLEGENIAALVRRTGRPAQMGYRGASGTLAALLRECSVGWSVGAPIVVEGRIWGVVNAGWRQDQPAFSDTERRMTQFTELIATAIANAESRAGLARLASEQAALRRVATLVACGAAPEEVFAAVTDEVGRVLSVEYAHLGRYELDGTVIFLASSGPTDGVLPVGARLTDGGKNVSTLVFETGRPARIDSYANASGAVAVAARERGVRSSVATPITVQGSLWGVVVVGSSREPQLPADTEPRLASFTELVATAVANAESRTGLARLAEEQAALRRVAMLVARGAAPEEVFAAVTGEVGRLLGTHLAGMARYNSDDTVTVLATWAAEGDHPLVRGPWPLEGGDLASTISRTGRPVRIDDYHGIPGRIAAFVREELGIGSSVGSPIVVDGRLWGALFVHSKQTHQPLPRDTESRLTGFTELVATAVANAESRAELMASRARIVAAADETRRRIERDLHDGTQQQLVSLILELRAAEASEPSEVSELREQLARTARGLGGVLDELQEISRGIHPAILSKGGLERALRALARRSAVPVELDFDAKRRLPEHVEVAAYYVVSEALTNAAKHARASVVCVELEVRDTIVRLAIRDDGIGGAYPGHGSGLVGLSDRIEALGGTLHVTSPSGDGTTLRVAMPLDGQISARSPQP